MMCIYGKAFTMMIMSISVLNRSICAVFGTSFVQHSVAGAFAAPQGCKISFEGVGHGFVEAGFVGIVGRETVTPSPFQLSQQSQRASAMLVVEASHGY